MRKLLIAVFVLLLSIPVFAEEKIESIVNNDINVYDVSVGTNSQMSVYFGYKNDNNTYQDALDDYSAEKIESIVNNDINVYDVSVGTNSHQVIGKD